jgi:hypothetical protein
MSFYLFYFLILVIYFYFTTHSFKISNAVIATSIQSRINMLLPEFQKKKERERKTEIYYFLPIYYSLLLWFTQKKKSLYTPRIAFIHLLYTPFIHPLYYNHLFTHFTTTIFACFIIFTLYVSPYHLSIYYTSIVSLIFFYFKICISSSCLN